MSFIEFESARDKEKNRNELRNVREQMLKEAEARFHQREEREKQKLLKGDTNFLLPSIEKKLKKNEKKSKKDKKKKKSSKSKKKRKKSSSSDSDSSSDDSDKKSRKKRKKKKYSSSSSSSSSESEDEWVVKEPVTSSKSQEPSSAPVRDSWMFDTTILTYSKEKKEPKKDEKKHIDSYDPTKSVKELNPYWKDGGSGLPSTANTFRKPKEDSDDEAPPRYQSHSNVQRGNWRKKAAVPEIQEKPIPVEEKPQSESSGSSESESEDEEPSEKTESKSSSMNNFLTDQQMNELGAKIVKAEIMGNEALAAQLKEKLELARECRKNVKVAPKNPQKSSSNKKDGEEEVVILTKSSTKGTSRPLDFQDPFGENRGGSKKKKQKPADTHAGGERVKFFPDDDKYDIKQMFEREKFTTSSDGDAQFTKIAMASSKAGSSRDNLEDIFASEAYKSMSDSKVSERERARAINEHQKTAKVLENCELCIDSEKIEKQLIVALGNKVYLSLPWHEGLQQGHCIISTTTHVSCSTNLDEDAWTEVNDFRKALTRMFAARKQDVIFFETVRYLHKNPHMVIHCVPSKDFEMAPFYFKKAIQESEREWSMNKQLIDLRKEKKDLRRAIPRGLPYFWVNFGMDDGFAHVIEEPERFPPNFAQEIIGGILELDARTYRKPRREHNPIPKVKRFAEWWKHYDCTRD